MQIAFTYLNEIAVPIPLTISASRGRRSAAALPEVIFWTRNEPRILLAHDAR